MNSSLRWLIWLAVLIGGWSITLDWQDELEKLLQQEYLQKRLIVWIYMNEIHV